jgi:hypothetical protein
MRNSPRHDLHSLVAKAEAEHLLLAREHDARCCDELDRRRRVMALELSRVIEKLGCAS